MFDYPKCPDQAVFRFASVTGKLKDPFPYFEREPCPAHAGIKGDTKDVAKVGAKVDQALIKEHEGVVSEEGGREVVNCKRLHGYDDALDSL